MMNPFREIVVVDPWVQPVGDVESIHQSAFDRCLACLKQVRNSHRSGSILIHGPAGGGKTHLLRRLRAHLSLKLPAATDREEALFVWVRLQTTPRMIWRTLRRTLVNDWFRPLVDQRSQFDRILYHQEARIRVAEGDVEPWHDYMLDEDPAGLETLIDKISDSLDLDRNTRVALQHLAFGRHRTDLREWLAGGALPEAVLERLELVQKDGTDEELEDVAQQAVLMLCRLAGDDLPIVLSFDQVEALETIPGDREALYSFGRLVSTLHDCTSNVLLISAVQSSFADRLLEESRAADRDRMTSFDLLSLKPLDREQGQALIQSRLKCQSAVHANSAGIPFWPLSPIDVNDLFANSSVTPRKLLARCADRFDELQSGEASLNGRDFTGHSPEPTDPVQQSPPASVRPSKVSQHLTDTWEATLLKKLQVNQPQQSEEIIRSAVPTLAQWSVAGTKSVVDEQLPDVAVILQGATGKVGVSVCSQPNMTSLSARLKRLKAQQTGNRLDRLVIVRDSRVPVTPTAKQARAHLKELEDSGAVVLHPTIEVLAALDALRGLLADAHSGDLACRGETISPQTLADWFVLHLADNLREFMDSILGTSEEQLPGNRDSQVLEALTMVLALQPLLPLVQAAARLNMPPEELAEVVRRHQDLFGLVDQPEMLVFRATPISTTS